MALSKTAKHGSVEKVELLGSTETIKWSQKQNALEIGCSKNYPSSDAVCYRITFKKSSD